MKNFELKKKRFHGKLFASSRPPTRLPNPAPTRLLPILRKLPACCGTWRTVYCTIRLPSICCLLHYLSFSHMDIRYVFSTHFSYSLSLSTYIILWMLLWVEKITVFPIWCMLFLRNTRRWLQKRGLNSKNVITSVTIWSVDIHTVFSHVILTSVFMHQT
jgi:hypothetical protein